jgi:hypothetical protein
MKLSHRIRAGALVAAGTLAIAAAPAAAQGPPPPQAANGNPVSTFTRVTGTPVDFAFMNQWTFIAVGPSEDPDHPSPGGLFVTDGLGPAVQVPGVPGPVFGADVNGDTLYASAGGKLMAYSQWNGTSFGSSNVVVDPPKGFGSFSGVTYGAGDRVYAGVALNEKYDNKRDPSPLARRVISVKPDGTGLTTIARGLRQPWQIAFSANSTHPWVTELAAEKKPIGPDFIAHVRQGQNYGFPKCTQARRKPCRGFTRPAILLPQHASPMGIAAVGDTLYVALFGGTGKGPEVASFPARRRAKPTPVLTGYAAPVVALGIHEGSLYTGDVTGAVYKVAL